MSSLCEGAVGRFAHTYICPSWPRPGWYYESQTSLTRFWTLRPGFNPTRHNKNWVQSGALSKFWCLNPNDTFWSQTDPNKPNFESCGSKLTKIKTRNWFEYLNLISKSYHFQGRCLNEHSFREGAVWRLSHTDTLPGQGLDDTPMIEVMKVGVRIQNWQGQAVELGVGQRPNNVRFKAFHILKLHTVSFRHNIIRSRYFQIQCFFIKQIKIINN